MRNFIIFLFTFFAINANGQFDYDCIGRDQFYILKSDLNFKSASIKKFSELKSNKAAENQFGKNYKTNRKVSEIDNVVKNNIEYDDGISVSIPEDQSLDVGFYIKSDNYILKLENGKTIKVGMKSDDIQMIFPKSFSKRAPIENIKGKNGKIGFTVYFSRLLNGSVQIEDARIIFILSKDGGILEEFYTYEPS